MDHERIRKEDIVERYILGLTNPEEEVAFEEHYFGCSECFSEVQTTSRIAQMVRQEIKKKGLEMVTVKSSKRFSLLERFRIPAFAPALATAASVCVLVLLYPAWQGIVTLPALERSVNELRKPQANLQSLFLQQLRSGDAGQLPVVRLHDKSGYFVLSFNILDTKLESPEFRGQIIDGAGNLVWEVDSLAGAGSYDVYSVLCHSGLFESGQYTMKVLEIDPADGTTVGETDYDFVVVKEW